LENTRNFDLKNTRLKSEIILPPEVVIQNKTHTPRGYMKKSLVNIESIKKVSERKPVDRKGTQRLVYPELVVDGESPAYFQGTQQEHMLKQAESNRQIKQQNAMLLQKKE
jgi:hypothetical protein